jgi:hypothetical protein
LARDTLAAVIKFKRRSFAIATTLFAASPLLCAFDSSEKPTRAGRLPFKNSAITGLFPLQVKFGKRHLIDASNRPFLINGDAAWSLLVQLSREQANFYLDYRRDQGFNTVLVNLIEHQFAVAPPKNYYGDEPFLIPGDFGTPNERYFAHADYVIDRAFERGIMVMLAPAYMGFHGGSEGWYREMQVNGTTKLQTYGRYLANRFRNHTNILWVHGGDFLPPDKALMRAVVKGIREADTHALNTFHGSRGTSATKFIGTEEQWLRISNIYTDASNVVNEALQEHEHSSKPFFLIEARYEGEGADEATVRLQAYQTVLSGGCGHIMGNLPVWKFGDGWQKALGSNGAHTITFLYSLLEAYAWAKLLPDKSNTFLISGIQTAKTRAVGALAKDGSFGILYMPSARRVTVNLSRLAGPNVRIQWYDPSNGHLSVIADSPFQASGVHAFEPAASNASGYSDWVLLFESIN